MPAGQTGEYSVGSLVRVRERDWVVLPSDDEDILCLRPLSGSESEICGIHRSIEGRNVDPTEFAPPQPEKAGDFIAGKLLRNAARLGLRNGAGPFRSIGRLSVRPRPYQFVPLIMALKLDPVRMLVADDVGVGKTIEAGLIAREMLDRGDARRLCVVCPPHLCDQWQTELETKFHVHAKVVRTSTWARLERDLPRRDLNVFEHYPHLIVSVDFVKRDSRRGLFIGHCPDLVIVDEAHTATEPGGIGSREQQQRHELVREVARDRARHLLLLTATPHSGIEGSLDPSRSKLGKYLRQKTLWGLNNNLTSDDGEKLIRALVDILKGSYVTVVPTEQGHDGIQLQAGALQWKLGDGTPPPSDPVRSKRMISERLRQAERQANQFFAQLYKETARRLVGVEGGAHTGQIPAQLRQDRETRFGRGDLAALFCSPTMELGVDIRDLNVVHLRNIPPTPANYAQRSGRAGRGGQPALVMGFCSEGSQHDQYFFRKPDLMVAGAVAPARLELGNKELVEAHIHSVWLAATGCSLGRDMTKVLDLEQAGFPLQADIQHRIELSESTLTRTLAESKRIVDACGEDLVRAPWYRDEWLRETLLNAPRAFSNAFDRWRELYTAAVRQRDENQAVSNRPTASKDDRRAADRRIEEAKREIDLLLNRSEESVESDFYPYRYLASEGFLPGYNFPRLPLRALVPSGKDVHVIDRPRFLGLGEFGPRNVIYHEGRKYRMARCVLPPGGVESRMVEAKFCGACGYFHDRENAKADRCDHCGTLLDGAHSQYMRTLFEMTTVRGFRVERITCDEEERLREGFEIETKYRFAPSPDGRALQQRAVAQDAEAHDLLQLTFAPQADLWRVNQRWRRSDRGGFTLDMKTGYWARRPDDDDRAPDATGNDLLTGVRPYVRDTRNLLLAGPVGDDLKTTDRFLLTLGYALQRGMQLLFQVEQQEIAMELIGEGENRRLLYWEAAEGGNGIWQRLIEYPDALGKVAEKALEACHFDPSTGEEAPGWSEKCSRACYDCLLSYSNQPAHPLIDRHLIRDFLLRLINSKTIKTAERSRKEQYVWLEERRDQNSSLERDVLKLLFETDRRLPDRAQYRPEQEVYAEADFYYELNGLPGVCVFCDGPDHDQPDRRESDERERGRLADLGYRIMTIRYDSPIEDQCATNEDVLGSGIK